MVASKFISTDKKHFQSWQYSEKYCRNLCHSDDFIIISRHTAWLEDSEAIAPMASKEKVFLKISLTFTIKNLCRRLFLHKVAGWKPTNSSNSDSGTGVFL